MKGSYHRPTYAEIDLAKFSNNIMIARGSSNSDIIAMVKADAYGHGATDTSLYAYKNSNVKHFAVATMTEGLELKAIFDTNNISDVNIYILGYITDIYIKEAIEQGLILTIFDDEFAKKVSDIAGSINLRVKVALKIDTGMKRLGFSPDSLLLDFLKKYPHIDVVHILSHLATSGSNIDFVNEQTKLFDMFIERNRGYNFTTSFLNSSGITNYENKWDFTRPGIAMYGYESTDKLVGIEPIMSIKSIVVHSKIVKKGESVSYGRTFIADRDMVIGIVPIGYADGYPTSLSNKGFMFIDGIKCQVVGVVCMDMVMIDLTDVEGIKVGRSVEVLGSNITADMLAKMAGTISYEILTGISYRIPRVYINERH